MYNRSDLKVNGEEVKTIKSLSPCAYCVKPRQGTCPDCVGYAGFEGEEVVIIKDQEEIV